MQYRTCREHMVISAVAIALSLFLGVGACAPAPFVPPSASTVFLDDFDGVPAGDWVIVREDADNYSLTDRTGFLRITTQEGALSSDAAIPLPNLFFVEHTGDFILLARLNFDPTGTRQLAGMIVQGDANQLVTFGLTRLSGVRGTIRGLLVAASNPSGGDPSTDFVDFAGDDVYLRLERTGNRFAASYSLDGDTYIPLDAVSTTFASTVQVGIGAGNGEDCGETCDLTTPADFDFFEIQILE